MSAATHVAYVGPHPDRPIRSTVVPALEGLLAVEDNAPYSGANTTWRFDFGTHAWEMFSLGPPDAVGMGALVYLPDTSRVLLVPTSPGGVEVLDLTTREWRAVPPPAHRPADVTDIAVDTRRGDVLAWSDWFDELWVYEPAGNRWREVARKAAWPSAAWGDGQHGYTLLSYDRGADRAVLSIIPIPGGRHGSTWLFDPATDRWQRADSAPPRLNYGYGEWMTNAVYDDAHACTVLFTWGVVATYDSARDHWDVPSRAGWSGLARRADGLYSGPLVRMDHQLVADPEHGRILTLGGQSFVDLPANQPPWNFEWRPDRSVWAYDVGANTWTRLSGG